MTYHGLIGSVAPPPAGLFSNDPKDKKTPQRLAKQHSTVEAQKAGLLSNEVPNPTKGSKAAPSQKTVQISAKLISVTPETPVQADVSDPTSGRKESGLKNEIGDRPLSTISLTESVNGDPKVTPQPEDSTGAKAKKPQQQKGQQNQKKGGKPEPKERAPRPEPQDGDKTFHTEKRKKLTKEDKLELGRQKELKRQQQLEAQKKNQLKKDGFDVEEEVKPKEVQTPKVKPQEPSQVTMATPPKAKGPFVKKSETGVVDLSRKTPEEELQEKKD